MYYAILKVENNRVAKFLEFDDQERAEAHVEKYLEQYPDALVFGTDAPYCDIYVDDQGASSVVPVPPPAPPTDEERIDAAFPGTDTARVIFEAFFEVANRLQALEGRSAITRPQLLDWLKAKLPSP